GPGSRIAGRSAPVAGTGTGPSQRGAAAGEADRPDRPQRPRRSHHPGRGTPGQGWPDSDAGALNPDPPGMTGRMPGARVGAMKTELLAVELAPGELPDSVTGWCRAFADRPGLALFDSALRHAELGRYSFLGIDPFARLEAQDGRVRLNGADV